MAFLGALIQTGYMTQLIAATHLVVGVLLLANRFVPLAIALFAPFIVNSIAFHSVLERSGLPMAMVFLALELVPRMEVSGSVSPDVQGTRQRGVGADAQGSRQIRPGRAAPSRHADATRHRSAHG